MNEIETSFKMYDRNYNVVYPLKTLGRIYPLLDMNKKYLVLTPLVETQSHMTKEAKDLKIFL